MKATYRRKVRNGLVTRRRLEAPRASRSGWVTSRQSPAVWAFIVVAAIVASGFVASLRWQLMAQQLSRDEVKLRARLDQIQTEQRYLKLEHVGALSPGRIESASMRAGLAPLKLDDPSAITSIQSRIRVEEQQDRLKAQELARRERLARERESQPGVKTVERKEKQTSDATVLIESPVQ